ncbi:hypothetical protein FPV67DRAFT_1682535 [Lyophyllum atratum]|nr:hypothetical protein FPV67DRAFT_1682535 [Lyophyllum atratum]
MHSINSDTTSSQGAANPHSTHIPRTMPESLSVKKETRVPKSSKYWYYESTADSHEKSDDGDDNGKAAHSRNQHHETIDRTAEGDYEMPVAMDVTANSGSGNTTTAEHMTATASLPEALSSSQSMSHDGQMNTPNPELDHVLGTTPAPTNRTAASPNSHWQPSVPSHAITPPFDRRLAIARNKRRHSLAHDGSETSRVKRNRVEEKDQYATDGPMHPIVQDEHGEEIQLEEPLFPTMHHQKPTASEGLNYETSSGLSSPPLDDVDSMGDNYGRRCKKTNHGDHDVQIEDTGHGTNCGSNSGLSSPPLDDVDSMDDISGRISQKTHHPDHDVEMEDTGYMEGSQQSIYSTGSQMANDSQASKNSEVLEDSYVSQDSQLSQDLQTSDMTANDDSSSEYKKPWTKPFKPAQGLRQAKSIRETRGSQNRGGALKAGDLPTTHLPSIENGDSSPRVAADSSPRLPAQDQDSFQLGESVSLPELDTPSLLADAKSYDIHTNLTQKLMPRGGLVQDVQTIDAVAVTDSDEAQYSAEANDMNDTRGSMHKSGDLTSGDYPIAQLPGMCTDCPSSGDAAYSSPSLSAKDQDSIPRGESVSLPELDPPSAMADGKSYTIYVNATQKLMTRGGLVQDVQTNDYVSAMHPQVAQYMAEANLVKYMQHGDADGEHDLQSEADQAEQYGFKEFHGSELQEEQHFHVIEDMDKEYESSNSGYKAGSDSSHEDDSHEKWYSSDSPQSSDSEGMVVSEGEAPNGEEGWNSGEGWISGDEWKKGEGSSRWKTWSAPEGEASITGEDSSSSKGWSASEVEQSIGGEDACRSEGGSAAVGKRSITGEDSSRSKGRPVSEEERSISGGNSSCSKEWSASEGKRSNSGEDSSCSQDWEPSPGEGSNSGDDAAGRLIDGEGCREYGRNEVNGDQWEDNEGRSVEGAQYVSEGADFDQQSPEEMCSSDDALADPDDGLYRHDEEDEDPEFASPVPPPSMPPPRTRISDPDFVLTEEYATWLDQPENDPFFDVYSNGSEGNEEGSPDGMNGVTREERARSPPTVPGWRACRSLGSGLGYTFPFQHRV